MRLPALAAGVQRTVFGAPWRKTVAGAARSTRSWPVQVPPLPTARPHWLLAAVSASHAAASDQRLAPLPLPGIPLLPRRLTASWAAAAQSQ